MYTSFVLCTRTITCSHLPVLQNQDSLLEGLVIDRDRTKISNIVQSSPLPRLATEPRGTSTPLTETQKPRRAIAIDAYPNETRTKNRGLASHAPNARLPPSPRIEQKPPSLPQPAPRHVF